MELCLGLTKMFPRVASLITTCVLFLMVLSLLDCVLGIEQLIDDCNGLCLNISGTFCVPFVGVCENCNPHCNHDYPGCSKTCERWEKLLSTPSTPIVNNIATTAVAVTVKVTTILTSTLRAMTGYQPTSNRVQDPGVSPTSKGSDGTYKVEVMELSIELLLPLFLFCMLLLFCGCCAYSHQEYVKRKMRGLKRRLLRREDPVIPDRREDVEMVQILPVHGNNPEGQDPEAARVPEPEHRGLLSHEPVRDDRRDHEGQHLNPQQPIGNGFSVKVSNEVVKDSGYEEKRSFTSVSGTRDLLPPGGASGYNRGATPEYEASADIDLIQAIPLAQATRKYDQQQLQQSRPTNLQNVHSQHVPRTPPTRRVVQDGSHDSHEFALTSSPFDPISRVYRQTSDE